MLETSNARSQLSPMMAASTSRVVTAPPASPSVAALKRATSDEMRSKFFCMIGIETKGPVPSSTPAPTKEVNKEWVHPRNQNIAVYKDNLKYDPVADKLFSTKRRKPNEERQTEAKPRRRLMFNETVAIIPIPMRTEYSNRVRSRLWSSATEIHENAARNTIEFAAEGWDWRTVTEDESMYVCVATGELIHPCHYEADFGMGKSV